MLSGVNHLVRQLPLNWFRRSAAPPRILIVVNLGERTTNADVAGPQLGGRIIVLSANGLLQEAE